MQRAQSDDEFRHAGLCSKPLILDPIDSCRRVLIHAPKRDMAVLQLFFGKFTSRETIARLAEDQVRLYRERLAVYQTIADQYHVAPMSQRRMAPLELGIRMAQACMDFWSDIARHPPEI